MNVRRGVIGAVGALLVIGAWWRLRPDAAPPEPLAPVGAARSPAPSPALAHPPEPPKSAVDYTADGTPIRPAGSAAVDARGMAPHPITPQHERIFRENNLIGALNSAMDNRDTQSLRRLLQEYRADYPEDANVLQVGYELIAGCQEQLTPERRATAQRYYDEERDSGLRRYIRRYCLEAS